MFSLLSASRSARPVLTARAPRLSGPLNHVDVRYASKKAAGKTSNGRDSNPKYRGFKRGHFQQVKIGNIILRQKGSKYHPGEGVGMGRDFTIFATKPGFVFINARPWLTRTGKATERKYINVVDERPLPPMQDIR